MPPAAGGDNPPRTPLTGKVVRGAKALRGFWRGLAILGMVVVACLGPAAGLAVAGDGVTAEVEPRETSLGRPTTLRVLVPGDALAVVDTSPITDFAVIPRGRVVGSRTGPDGKPGQVAAYRFELAPRRAGDCVVPALAVKTGGARLLTNPVTRWFFYFVDGGYYHGLWYPVLFIVAGLYFAMAAAVLMAVLARRLAQPKAPGLLSAPAQMYAPPETVCEAFMVIKMASLAAVPVTVAPVAPSVSR